MGVSEGVGRRFKSDLGLQKIIINSISFGFRIFIFGFTEHSEVIMAKTATVAFQLKCTEKVDGKDCGSLNYTTSKNATENKDKIVINKFCKKCRKTTEHKEAKISKAKK